MSLVGERKAVAAAALGFFGMLFTLNALVGPPGLGTLFGAMAIVYGVGFFGVVAGWFWARWYALGIGFSGIALALLIAFKIGMDPTVWIWGVPHLAMVAMLSGRGPSLAFDGRADWRERYRLDDDAVHRLGRSVMRAGASLPYLVMAALAPRDGGGEWLWVAAAALGVLGVRGLVRLRGWAPLALAGAAGLAGVGVVATASSADVLRMSGFGAAGVASGVVGLVAAVLLAAAFAPFARPMARYLAGR